MCAVGDVSSANPVPGGVVCNSCLQFVRRIALKLCRNRRGKQTRLGRVAELVSGCDECAGGMLRCVSATRCRFTTSFASYESACGNPSSTSNCCETCLWKAICDEPAFSLRRDTGSGHVLCQVLRQQTKSHARPAHSSPEDSDLWNAFSKVHRRPIL
jgi:hypothetical protein